MNKIQNSIQEYEAWEAECKRTKPIFPEIDFDINFENRLEDAKKLRLCSYEKSRMAFRVVSENNIAIVIEYGYEIYGSKGLEKLFRRNRRESDKDFVSSPDYMLSRISDIDCGITEFIYPCDYEFSYHYLSLGKYRQRILKEWLQEITADSI